MPAINFLQRYAPAILVGTKHQTIRKPRADHRPHATIGAKLFLYTGMRSKSCKKLFETVCTNTSQIVIDNDPYRVIVNGVEVQDEDRFAQADGFPSVAELFDFFEETHGLPFHGTLIEWEPPTSVEREKRE